MSITTGDFRSKITATTLWEKKQKHEPITCLTAYDYASARLVDEAGIDMVLVGDSLGMVMLGYENTLPVTVEEMLHHTRAVRRGVKRAFLITDMPFASYHVSGKETRAQCGALHQGWRRGREDRRRREARPVGGAAGGCRDPRGRPHRTDPAIAARHGRLQSAGQVAEGRRAAHARCARAGALRGLLRGAGRHPARSGRADHPRNRDPHHRHRRRSRLRRTGAGVPRPAGADVCAAREVRAALRRPGFGDYDGLAGVQERREVGSLSRPTPSRITCPRTRSRPCRHIAERKRAMPV